MSVRLTTWLARIARLKSDIEETKRLIDRQMKMNGATQACNCDGPKVIAGKEALRAYWLDQFKAHPVSDLLGLQSEEDGESLSFQTSKGVVRARLHIDQSGRILRVECGLMQ